MAIEDGDETGYPEAGDAAELAPPEPAHAAAVFSEDPKDGDDHHSEDVLAIYLKDVQKSRLLTAEEERQLAGRVAQDDKAAREQMIRCNLRLVLKIAKRYVNRGLPLLDLIEEGNIGLIKAVDRFRVEKGFRFSTYATWWIRQSIERALTNLSRTIRLPVHIADDVSRAKRYEREMRGRLKREPRPEEIAKAMGVAPGYLEHLLRMSQKTYSIEHPMGEEGDLYLHDLLEDEEAAKPFDMAEHVQEFEKIRTWMQDLSASEREILKLRFGLEDTESQTLEVIGKKFGVTRERIRQIQCQSLKKIRQLKNEDVDFLFDEPEPATDSGPTGKEQPPGT